MFDAPTARIALVAFDLFLETQLARVLTCTRSRSASASMRHGLVLQVKVEHDVNFNGGESENKEGTIQMWKIGSD